MKTNRTASRIVRIRSIVLGLAFIGMVGASFWSSQALAGRFGQPAAPQAETQHAPVVNLGEFMGMPH